MMRNNLILDGNLVLEKMDINPYNLRTDFTTREQRYQYRAVVNWIKDYTPKVDTTNLIKVKGLVEAFYHLCELKDWDRVKVILEFRLNTPTHEEFHLQIGTWGYYQEQTNLYNHLLQNVENLHPFIKVACLHGKGSIEYAKGHYLKAINYYKQAQLLLKLPQDEHQLGVILNSMGLAYISLKEFDKAKQHFWQRLLIAWKNKELEQEGVALNNLGIVYHERKEPNKAIKYQKRSLSIVRITGNRLGEGKVLGCLGSNYGLLGNYSKALEYQQQHLVIAQESQDSRDEAVVLCNIGITLMLLRKNYEAIEFCINSIKICKTISAYSVEVYALKYLTLIYLILGERVLALNYCDKALLIAIELDIPLVKELQNLKKELLVKQL